MHAYKLVIDVLPTSYRPPRNYGSWNCIRTRLTASQCMKYVHALEAYLELFLTN